MLGRALNMPLRVLHDIQVLHLVGKNMSLLERIQNRLQSNSNNLNILKETPRISTCDNVSETESESESDINDDITIEECAAIMTQRKKEKEHAFTRVKSKPPVQLRDFLSEKMTFLENQTANNLLSNDHEQYCGDKSEENEINDVLMSDVNSENNANEQINDALCKNIPLVSSDSCSNDSGIQLNKNLSSISIPESCKIHLNNKFSGTNSISIESNTNENDNSSKISIDTEGINLSVPVKRKRAKLTPEEKQVFSFLVKHVKYTHQRTLNPVKYLLCSFLEKINFAQRIANSVLNKGNSAIPPISNGPEVLCSASDKVKLYAENFSKNSNLDDSGISLSVVLSRTNLKMHIIHVTPEFVKKVIANLRFVKGVRSD